MNVSSSGSRMLRLRTPNIGGIFHLKHLVSSGPQTRKEFFFPTEKRSIGSASRCTRSPNKPFGLIDLFPIGDRRPGMALNREFGFIDLVNRLPEKAPNREFGLRTVFLPRTAKNVGLSSGLARFRAIMSWNHDTSWSSSSAPLRGAPATRRMGRRRLHTLSIIWCV